MAQRPAEAALVAHLGTLVDAVTKTQVTSDTRLVALPKLRDPDEDQNTDENPAIDWTLLNIFHGPLPLVSGQLETPDGRCFPSDWERAGNATNRYEILITFDDLLTAPVIRLLCKFKGDAGRVYLTITLDFHFNAVNTEISSISDFQWQDRLNSWTGNYEQRIMFISHGATCSGFGNIAQHRSKLGQKEMEVIEVLTSYLSFSDARRFAFIFPLPMGFVHAIEKFQQIRQRLPGGSGTLLHTIGRPEYAAFGSARDKIEFRDLEIATMGELVRHAVPFPMFAQPGTNTFSGRKQVEVQFALSIETQHQEGKRGLALWSLVSHKAQMYNVPGLELAVIGVTFRKHNTLGSRTEKGRFRLPQRLPTDMCFIVSPDHDNKYSGFLLPDTWCLPPKDAYFIITSHNKAYFGDFGINDESDNDDQESKSFNVKFSPHFSNFTRNSQMATIKNLFSTKNSRWHQILYNQGREELPIIDLTAGCPASPAEQSAADRELLNEIDWNAYQLEPITAIKRTPGGVMVVLGPAGTGKTRLQQALSVHFWKLGFHVIVVAPANSNCDKSTRDMGARQEPGMRFHRLYPSSRDHGPDRMTAEQAQHRRVGHEHGNATSIHELQFILAQVEAHENHKVTARDFGVEQAVIDEADKGELSGIIRPYFCPDETAEDPDDRVRYLNLDIWDTFRECLAAVRAGEFNSKNKEQEKLFTWSYDHCKAHIIRLTRYMITTTGNALSSELVGNFGMDEEGDNFICKGIVVFVDEACKDIEQNIWAPIVCGAWAEKVKGFIMFGDEKQLKPTNTSAKGALEFNPYNERLETPLPLRLVREGHPCFRLEEQMRMHSDIADFPNRKFYGGRLRNGPGTNVPLDHVEPGLKDVLHSIIAKEKMTPQAFLCNATDTKARNAWIEVKGIAEYSPDNSKRIAKHADVFFKKIWPKLHEHFGDRMEENVMVICAYSFARNYWVTLANKLSREQDLPSSALPRIVMLDSSQGQESFMTILDASLDAYGRLGFLDDEGRCNVALTRAKAVRWIIGGSMKNKTKENRDWRHDKAWENGEVPHFAQLKQEMNAASLVHKFS